LIECILILTEITPTTFRILWRRERAEIKKRVVETNADLGIAIDGDADRAFFIDKKRKKTGGVYIGVLLAKSIIKENSMSENKKIIHDPRITWPFINEAKNLGAETIQCVAGHSFFKQKMADEQALFGAEASSHFYYKNFIIAIRG
jgi:phosphomannomutase